MSDTTNWCGAVGALLLPLSLSSCPLLGSSLAHISSHLLQESRFLQTWLHIYLLCFSEKAKSLAPQRNAKRSDPNPRLFDLRLLALMRTVYDIFISLHILNKRTFVPCTTIKVEKVVGIFAFENITVLCVPQRTRGFLSRRQ